VLYNRSDSLKISQWLDYLLIDGGNLIYVPPDPEHPEPIPFASWSDVSVFFNSAAPGVVPVLQITPVFSGGVFTARAIELEHARCVSGGPAILRRSDVEQVDSRCRWRCRCRR
jgi:hypothetical protein